MELQFNKSVCPCLRKVISQLQTQEQTQEIRVPDSMPDIGRVLGCWGQTLIRGKEWRGNGMNVSGGVMVWVLYQPEDGSEPRSIDSWIPFQEKWDFSDTQRDGTICVSALLKSVDARSISARKLMLRAVIDLYGQAFEPVDMEVYAPPAQLPEDIALLKETYPVQLPQEAGEKSFQLDEQISIPQSLPQIQKILHYELLPEIAEQKILAGRLVFRGKAMLHMLYRNDDGSLNSWDTELPFSQFSDLDKEYGNNATAWVLPLLTGLEVEQGEDGKLLIKAGITVQYVIYDRTMLELVEDAYSPFRQVEIQRGELDVPVLLDAQQEKVQYCAQIRGEYENVVDVFCQREHPACRQRGDAVQVELPAQYQVLCYDAGGSLQCLNVRGEETRELISDRNNDAQVHLLNCGFPMASINADGIQIEDNVIMNLAVHSCQGLPMVTALNVGELQEADPNRPSLILRRVGDGKLWDLAKECGSTVEAIRKTNQLQQEPGSDQMLLIPVC